MEPVDKWRASAYWKAVAHREAMEHEHAREQGRRDERESIARFVELHGLIGLAEKIERGEHRKGGG